MSAARKELQEALCCYTADTLKYIHTVNDFCERSHEWILKLKKALDELIYIKENADESTNIFKELDALHESTQEVFEKVDCFMDAVEYLSVTSIPLFIEENRMFNLPEGISHVTVQLVIIAAWRICPHLLVFKEDQDFQNVEVLAYMLDKFITILERICEALESSLCNFCPKMNDKTPVILAVDLSEDNTQRMLLHIKQLEEIRKNESFRMVFMFQEDELCSGFIDKFKERQPRMEQFLKDLEEYAVQLDMMNKGAKISSVAGSSVGAVGGILSIVGLALSPVTAGLSLALTMTGVGMSITSGVNSAVTTGTEFGVNKKYQNQAKEVIESYIKDMQCLTDYVEEVTTRETIFEVAKWIWKIRGISKKVSSFVEAASAFKLLKSEELAASAGKVAVQEGKALRSIPKVGQAAAKGPLALSKAARVGSIGLNALFVGFDVFFICKDSMSLAQGSETEFSKLIRARAVLWRTEVDSMQHLHDHLCEGLKISEKNKAILLKPIFQRGR